ncbi:N2227-domain-containing protein [Eremomyces bilateralis CBS 781.70]|uniref:carnosine N-methyltransferase n=1 Tax=Eremomyces bilateralis CBS 781.70 TaxID=1392243 RepID=A0A6G1FUI8_9PEZI|nr:N2227-domain-containing protein [Eremomyces bilateralis CBS 781.70]KAF1809555.1 N2227-domain-containing protein [Eremomyces bilateralis CBS 781.70]
MDDPEEQRVFLAAINSFYSYRRAAHLNVTHTRRQCFYNLPESHWSLLAREPFNLQKVFNDVDDAIDSNADIAEAIANAGFQSFGLEPPEKLDSAANVSPSDLDKARSTIRQLYRDWSAEGEAERLASYVPVFAALRTHFPFPETELHGINILVPGAGLGRLVLELAKAGYTVEGNEISYHQLLASSFMLNHTQRARQFELYPWALTFSNHLSRSNQMEKIMVPDVHPGTFLDEASQGLPIHAGERMSMAAADFCEVYKQPTASATFDAVVTVFFIDTAPNLIHYIQAVHNCLKDGGLWVNLGPLLFHFDGNAASRGDTEDMETSQNDDGGRFKGIGEPGSVELTNEEVLDLVERLGFKVVESKETGLETGYIQDPRAMLNYSYRPSFWVAKKCGPMPANLS